jgi:hypothetical protein
MIIFDERRFAKTPFENEADLEQTVASNYEHIFGPSSIFLSKSKIETRDGTGTIPDGFAVDLESEEWYIVEAELSHHSTWNHIIPQVTKQIQASVTPQTKKIVEELAVESYSSNENTKKKFQDIEVEEVNIRRHLRKILDKKPIVGIPIDDIPNNLDRWTQTLKYNVKLWVIKKFAEIGDPSKVIYNFPENYEPKVDTERDMEGRKEGIEKTDVSMEQLVESGIINDNETLEMNYNPRGGNRKKYEANVLGDGSLELLGQRFSSPSSAAVAAIQDAGSNRETENGWRVWETKDGRSIDELRKEYSKSRN